MTPQNPASLLQLAARSPSLSRKLNQLKAGSPVDFHAVPPEAMSLLAALVAQSCASPPCFVCPDQKSLDHVYTEFLSWDDQAMVFPEIEMAATENAVADPELTAERLDILRRLAGGSLRGALFATRDAMDSPVPDRMTLASGGRRIARGQTSDMGEVAEFLADAGFERVTKIDRRGQFAIRGGILDVFALHHTRPVRIEFFDDKVESVREFDIHRQTTIAHVDKTELLADIPADGEARLPDYLARNATVVSMDAGMDNATIRISSGFDNTDAAPIFESADAAHLEAGDFILSENARTRFLDQLDDWRTRGWAVAFVCNNDGESQRLRDLLAEQGRTPDNYRFLEGVLSGAFTVPDAQLAVLSDAALFGRHRMTAGVRKRIARARVESARARLDFGELKPGDHVVHLEHGIGIYNGMLDMPDDDGAPRDVIEIEFADEARLYVPVEHAYLVSRYVGIGKRTPKLSKLGGRKWQLARRQAERSVFDYAASLLELHAERESTHGHAFEPDTTWQREFEASFVYRETPDQLKAIAETKADMESTRPMDRLICGDVGFGKTEVAIRAAFKAVMGGRQVAVLVPTTVLAQQHEQTFRERMSDYPVTIRALSRFVPRRNQRETLRGLADGSVDIVIGTHRLLSADVVFHKLGLVVIDEEQRFGVAHKERFKTLFRLVDVLTLSATPIPRTLYLSMMGARDMSVIETPPPNRLPVESVVCPYDERVIRKALLAELERGGQTFFLHNRVGSIESVRKRIQHLCPNARVDIGHGQMDELQLEDVMHRFVNGITDILVSTTIIESGLDIPNANTIIINRADQFGLADLYQLRGRVGRAQQKAYAYFLLPRDMMTRGEARKRIGAIRQYASLGAGFRIAMRDLEIRGAGSLLGTAQSGHIMAVGFDLYCQLLKQAVARLKGERNTLRTDVPVDLDFVERNEAAFPSRNPAHFAPAYFPTSLLPEPEWRIHAHRQLAEAASQNEIDQIRSNWRDQFGPLPDPVENLVTLAEIRVAAAQRRIDSVQVRDGKVMMERGGGFLMEAGRFPRLTAKNPSRNVRDTLKMVREH